ncbi:GYF domain-containing protein [Lysobacter yananisis]|uniref:GYF domain-containing protein n=1 Tax=Lysobacter yananisis TaxID=1003114 RepID=A0ABY9PBN6_9GAMM|nr:GYF domain-containing protein [Lysobacter yananisis]WMT04185.1 GYF domain-containing protein [Lysobacter yananisis]
MTHWYYHEPSQGRVGPIDADALREHVRAGRVRRDTLVWRAGLSGWLPLQQVEDELGLADAPPPLPPGAAATPIAATQAPLAAATPNAPGAAPAPTDSAPAPAAAPAAPAAPASPAATASPVAAPAPQGRADFSAAVAAAETPQPAAQAPIGASAPQPADAAPAQPQRSVSPADYAPAHVARRQQAAPPPKRGMSGCLIALIVVAVLAIPVLGILAAIALPAYQDYTHRAKLAGVMAEAGSYKLQVAEHYLEHEGCPNNASPGFRPAADYAGPQLASVEFGRFKDSGQCAIQLELRGFDNRHLDGRKLWLSFDPNSHEWTCSTDIDKPVLVPQSCRQ